jgi:fructose-1,6-bisphosphatase/inositol monophosphatase family enzyme
VTDPVAPGLVVLLERTADAVADALAGISDWGLTGRRPGEHHSDVAADRAAVETLLAGGVGVLSEESGLHHADRPVTVVVDPLDGSTNAARGIPWYATSLCAVDGDGPLAALVVHLPTGRRYHAVRGAGAWCDGEAIRPTACGEMARAVVGLSGYPPTYLGWYQYRVLGALALDLCAVASGLLDAYVDCSPSAHGPWDYLGGVLVCQEAGALASEAYGRELVELEHGCRRTPVAAATPELLAEALAARATLPW